MPTLDPRIGPAWLLSLAGAAVIGAVLFLPVGTILGVDVAATSSAQGVAALAAGCLLLVLGPCVLRSWTPARSTRLATLGAGIVLVAAAVDQAWQLTRAFGPITPWPLSLMDPGDPLAGLASYGPCAPVVGIAGLVALFSASRIPRRLA
jgi:hypothetical protein